MFSHPRFGFSLTEEVHHDTSTRIAIPILLGAASLAAHELQAPHHVFDRGSGKVGTMEIPLSAVIPLQQPAK
jgi:hypothetical protein